MIPKLNLLIFLLLVGIILSCSPNKNPCNLPKETLTWVNQIDSAVKTRGMQMRDSLWNNGDYDEPSILHAKYETYRYKRHYSLENRTEVVRIEKREDTYWAILKETDWGMDRPFTVTRNEEFEISKDEWDTIVNGLNTNNFWTFTPYEESQLLDPTTTTIEGYKLKKDPCTAQHYHFVSRETYDDTTFIAMYKLFDTLLHKHQSDLTLHPE
jgi:hypothetical protein